MVFNKRGVTLPKYSFYLNGIKISVTDQYQYLGLKLKPSGMLQTAVEELHDKATRAWFGISNIVYKNVRMESKKVFGIFDALVTPVALYSCEFWTPYLISKSSFTSSEKLLDAWGTLKAETLNQKCSRMILSVHNKASRLAVLGELGRYPLFTKSISQCLNYKYHLMLNKTSSSLMYHVYKEMKLMASTGQDCWLTRVNKIEELLNIRGGCSLRNKKGVLTTVKSKFDAYWLNKINEFRGSTNDDYDHNKLRLYKQFKASFSKEPYIDFTRNRNQRSYLTRLRVSAHSLAIESGRRARPIVPISERICSFCRSLHECSLPNQTAICKSCAVDDEVHFLTICPRFENTRSVFYSVIESDMPGFKEKKDDHKFLTLVCPTSPQIAKTVNRYIRFMFEQREKIVAGENLYNL